MSKWINVDDELPETFPHAYESEMSRKVLVRGIGKDAYPWVAHLHKSLAQKYPHYAFGFDRDGARYTWLNPYRDIGDNQRVKQWMPLPEPPEQEG